MFVIPELTSQQWAILLGGIGLFMVLSFYAIWDAVHRDFETHIEKMMWVQVAALVPFLGGLAYILIGRKRGTTSR